MATLETRYAAATEFGGTTMYYNSGSGAWVLGKANATTWSDRSSVTPVVDDLRAAGCRRAFVAEVEVVK